VSSISFTANKLIGARYFNKGYASASGAPLAPALMTPRDENGHGTHTLATAGGAAARGAFAFAFGYSTGTARVAAYRVCFRPVNNGSECFDADVLAGFEAAIRDSAHVISASVSGGDALDYLEDAVAIGSLHAVKAGVTVVCSAGNNGPDPGTVTNAAPCGSSPSPPAPWTGSSRRTPSSTAQESRSVVVASFARLLGEVQLAHT
jgi:subtilisin family serine protease